MALFERMLIAGVGLIGGSLGLAARGRRLVNETVGYGRGEENLKIARQRGAIDRYSRSAQEAARGADLSVLAVPVRSPHVVAYALIAAIEAERVAGRDPLTYSGGGLRDTTRIASSHPEMWRDIFLDNRAEVLRAIDGFGDAVARLRRMIESEEPHALEAEL